MLISDNNQTKAACALLAVGTFLLVGPVAGLRYQQPHLRAAIENEHRIAITEALKQQIGHTSHGGPLFADYSVLGAERERGTTKAYLLAMCEEYVRKPNGQLELASGTWTPVVAEFADAQSVQIHRPGLGGDYRRTLEELLPWPVRQETSWDKRVELMSSHVHQEAVDYFAKTPSARSAW